MFFSVSFSVDESTVPSSMKSKAFLKHDIIATKSSPSLTCVDADFEFKSFSFCIVSLLSFILGDKLPC